MLSPHFSSACIVIYALMPLCHVLFYIISASLVAAGGGDEIAQCNAEGYEANPVASYNVSVCS